MQDFPAIILKDFRQYAFHYDSLEENLQVDYTEHYIIRTNTLSAVEEFNRVYISLSGTNELVNLQARCISPDGKVIELGEESMKEIDDPESAGAYRIFAIEGLVPGAEVEYAYTVRMDARFYGRDVYQRDIPVKEAVWELIAPDFLVFGVKSYNGMGSVTDSVKEGYRRIHCAGKDIPEALSERYALYQPYLQRLEFNLLQNLQDDLLYDQDWSGMAKRYIDLIYHADKADIKAMNQVIKWSGAKAARTKREKVVALERWIKGNISLQDTRFFDYPEVMVENRYGSSFGFLRLMSLCLSHMGIYHELVLVADREGYPLDPEFPNWTYLEEVFLYFQQFGEYLHPSAFEYRMGEIPYAYRGTPAVFVQPGRNQTNLLTRTGVIPESTLNRNYDDLQAEIRFEVEESVAQIELERSFKGYRAIALQPYLEFLPQETILEVANDLLQGSLPGAEISSSRFEKATLSDAEMGEPLVLKAQMRSEGLLERAGQRYLFRVGEVIGPQVEMYQSGKRDYAVDVQYPHGYNRTIVLHCPEGYRFDGLDELRRSIVHRSDSMQTEDMGFVSDYTLDGDSLKIEIHEYYSNTSYPVEDFDAFRQVINAAADFNKVSILLEPVR